jgi:hypothetical protein
MYVSMAVATLLELKTPISPLPWKLGRMATLARDALVRAHQGKRCLWMRA